LGGLEEEIDFDFWQSKARDDLGGLYETLFRVKSTGAEIKLLLLLFILLIVENEEEEDAVLVVDSREDA
jgi:hypothetical protein